MNEDGREPRTCPVCGELCHYDGWGHVHASGIGIGSCAPASVQGSDGLREVNDAATEDVRAIAVALGLGGHARPYSAHEVVRREILPAVQRLLAAEAERDQARAQARQAWDVHAEHVDRMNVLLLQAQAERDEAITELRALVEAASRGDHVWPPAYRRAREYVRALDGTP